MSRFWDYLDTSDAVLMAIIGVVFVTVLTIVADEIRRSGKRRAEKEDREAERRRRAIRTVNRAYHND